MVFYRKKKKHSTIFILRQMPICLLFSQYKNRTRTPINDIKFQIAKLFNVSLDSLMELSLLPNDETINKLSNDLSELDEADLLEIMHFIQYIKFKHK